MIEVEVSLSAKKTNVQNPDFILARNVPQMENDYLSLPESKFSLYIYPCKGKESSITSKPDKYIFKNAKLISFSFFLQIRFSLVDKKELYATYRCIFPILLLFPIIIIIISGIRRVHTHSSVRFANSKINRVYLGHSHFSLFANIPHAWLE